MSLSQTEEDLAKGSFWAITVAQKNCLWWFFLVYKKATKEKILNILWPKGTNSGIVNNMAKSVWSPKKISGKKSLNNKKSQCKTTEVRSVCICYEFRSRDLQMPKAFSSLI